MLQNNLDIQVLKMEMSQYPASISALLILCLVSFSVEAYGMQIIDRIFWYLGLLLMIVILVQCYYRSECVVSTSTYKVDRS